MNKLAGCGAVGSEDGRSVTIGIGVNDVDCFVEIIRLQADQHRPEYLLLVTLHMWLKYTRADNSETGLNSRLDQGSLVVEFWSQ